MSDPVKLKITKAGLEAALSADINGIMVSLDKVKFSTDRFASVMNDERTTLDNVVIESAIAAGGTSITQNTLRCFSVVNSVTLLSIGSVGLYTDNDVLFAIASVEEGELLKILPKISFVMSFGVTLAAILLENIQIVIDPEASVAAALIFQHENHDNPHPQYKDALTDKQGQIDAIVDYVDNLNNRLNNLANSTAGNINANNFKYYWKWFNAGNTPYPGERNYDLINASVEVGPNNKIEQTIRYTAYGRDTYHHIYLPVALSEEFIVSVNGTIKSPVEPNDVAFKVHSIYNRREGNRVFTIIVCNVDHTNAASPYNGAMQVYVTIKGMCNFDATQVVPLDWSYPQSFYP